MLNAYGSVSGPGNTSANAVKKENTRLIQEINVELAEKEQQAETDFFNKQSKEARIQEKITSFDIQYRSDIQRNYLEKVSSNYGLEKRLENVDLHLINYSVSGALRGFIKYLASLTGFRGNKDRIANLQREVFPELAKKEVEKELELEKNRVKMMYVATLGRGTQKYNAYLVYTNQGTFDINGVYVPNPTNSTAPLVGGSGRKSRRQNKHKQKKDKQKTQKTQKKQKKHKQQKQKQTRK